MTNPNIIFFGTSEFSAQILNAVAAKYPVTAVVTQPDKPVGRKQIVTPSLVAKTSEALGLKILKPTSLKTEEVFSELSALKPDLFVVVAYGKIIPKNILELAVKGPINIHGSILPKYRGASPIHSALLNGEKETGITIMLMDEQMDHGPILLQESLEINPNDTFIELEKKLADLSEKLILQAIPDYLEGKLPPKEQDHSAATFTKIISKEDGKIDWNKTALEIYNQHRAYIVWPEIWTTFGGKILKIKNCRLAEDPSDHNPGKVYQKDGKVYVQAGLGSLELLEVQPEGKNTMSVSSFVAGHKDFTGVELS